MDLTFCWKALKFSSEGVHRNFPFFWTLKCQPRKSNPSIARVIFVFFSLMLHPLFARNVLILSSISSALSLGLRIITYQSDEELATDFSMVLTLIC